MIRAGYNLITKARVKHQPPVSFKQKPCPKISKKLFKAERCKRMREELVERLCTHPDNALLSKLQKPGLFRMAHPTHAIVYEKSIAEEQAKNPKKKSKTQKVNEEVNVRVE